MCDPVTAISAAASGVGALLQIGSTVDDQANLEAMNAAQQKQIAAERAQTALQNQQQQRQVLRNAATARANGLTASVGQGAGASSSGVLGARGAITSDAGVAYNTISQTNTNSNTVYDAESEYATANMKHQEDMGIAQLGGAIAGSAQALGRVGGTLFGGSSASNLPMTGWTTVVV